MLTSTISWLFEAFAKPGCSHRTIELLYTGLYGRSMRRAIDFMSDRIIVDSFTPCGRSYTG
ncbi:MAG: hypothetical protein JGK17_06805 [Microcoleus sp. PH2017_10_PVI_O_A]|uniref:hypothetical protein n=1 Tax=unclassified Microcoleus TaxID=2642155 RepID=UPI001DF43948|nr:MULTISPECIES: hypothetical protein [unclassified Microcoleus]MCC3405295.1 hypothetical protein [Microcoleus sp. PH2017_10_PVI_O_A]MCC3458853.1 hypothetical protein [Microcoleus sp. PH2017_11_PCY_U_A]MCC3477101.1 hypothetical protein [Microcoleus sp. PH2017_12_PCY_D_A]MCC3528288.1 hypothetical protein [Microcoleus sp. PH2017_21_RUC_O_A]MCC3540465.1 hypothetical protein [Microcoleus sp. PH2017_22_RUC_O_B]